jgi:hypothetical protein
MSFSDSLVIQAVYLSISPLFLPESTTAPKKKGKEKAAGAGQIASPMKTFRMEAMGCLRAVSCFPLAVDEADALDFCSV